MVIDDQCYVLWFIRDLHWHVESSFGAPVSVKSTSSVFSNACNSSGHLQSIHNFESKSVSTSKYIVFANLGDKIPFLREIFYTDLDVQICFERKTFFTNLDDGCFLHTQIWSWLQSCSLLEQGEEGSAGKNVTIALGKVAQEMSSLTLLETGAQCSWSCRRPSCPEGWQSSNSYLRKRISESSWLDYFFPQSEDNYLTSQVLGLLQKSFLERWT